MPVKWNTRRKTEEQIERENEAMADAIEELGKDWERKKSEMEAAEKAKMPTFKRRF
jgi:hypothetical protein